MNIQIIIIIIIFRDRNKIVDIWELYLPKLLQQVNKINFIFTYIIFS